LRRPVAKTSRTNVRHHVAKQLHAILPAAVFCPTVKDVTLKEVHYGWPVLMCCHQKTADNWAYHSLASASNSVEQDYFFTKKRHLFVHRQRFVSRMLYVERVSHAYGITELGLANEIANWSDFVFPQRSEKTVIRSLALFFAVKVPI